jgi:hypothetical protein
MAARACATVTSQPTREFVARLFRGEDSGANGEKSPASNPSLSLRAREAGYKHLR